MGAGPAGEDGLAGLLADDSAGLLGHERRRRRWGGRLGVVAQNADETTGIGQGGAPGLGEHLERLLGHVGAAVDRGHGAVGHGDHDGQRVGDDVVHLAGDATALVGRREKGLLLPGQRQARRAHLDLVQLDLLDP